MLHSPSIEMNTSPYGAYSMPKRAATGTREKRERGEDILAMTHLISPYCRSPSSSSYPYYPHASSASVYPPSPCSPAVYASSLHGSSPSSSTSSSSPFTTQTLSGKIPKGNKGELVDIRYIKPHELAHILQNKQTLDLQVVIVDCRYPYEYQGGHIEGSINLFSNEMIHKAFLSALEGEKGGGVDKKNMMIVFHCEFSSVRGPAGYRYLREHDRRVNYVNYPKLNYPNMFLLEDGYKNFYPDYKHLCSGGYIEMVDKNYSEELKIYRRVQKTEKSSRKRALFSDDNKENERR